MAKVDKAIEEENAKRKELSRVRIFWLLLGLTVAIIIVIVIQFLILFSN